MESELKPCPFCEGEASQEYNGNEPYVRCVDCGASIDGKSGAWNTRPAPASVEDELYRAGMARKRNPDIAGDMPDPAPVEGLETVEHHYWHDQTQEWLPTGFPDRYRKDGVLVRELVTRPQAEAIIAAERNRAEVAVAAMVRNHQRAEKAETDNAALTARVKELEDENKSLTEEWYRGLRVQQKICDRAEALEAKLAAAEKALERLTLHANALALAHVLSIPADAGIWDALKDARAVTGGKQ